MICCEWLRYIFCCGCCTDAETPVIRPDTPAARSPGMMTEEDMARIMRIDKAVNIAKIYSTPPRSSSAAANEPPPITLPTPVIAVKAKTGSIMSGDGALRTARYHHAHAPSMDSRLVANYNQANV